MWAFYWAKLDLQLGPADGRRPGPAEAGGRAGTKPPQVRRKGPAARARDTRRRQEWKERRKEPTLELPASQSREPMSARVKFRAGKPDGRRFESYRV